MLIGGLQDPGRANNLNLLFYKTDNFRIGGQGPTASYDIKVDYK